MIDYLVTLQNEFEAGEGSFLIQLRIDRNWEKPSFTRLVAAMKKCCEDHAAQDKLERWMANGFYFIPTYVLDSTLHPGYHRPHAPEYYEKAYQRLDDLAYWFFFGESPYVDGQGFDEM